MVFPQMLHPELIGRSPVKRTELRYRTNVGLMSARRQIAHRHVVDHALAQRRDRLGHRWTPVYWTAQRAILSDRVFSCDGHSPSASSHWQGSKKVLRRENGPVEPYSLSLAVAESRSSIGEGSR